MNRRMCNRISEFVLALALLAPVANAEEWQLSAAEWSRPRSGIAVARMPAVAEAVRAWQAATAAGQAARLQLVFPGGEEGSLWASELRDWLVALAVPPGAIELVPGGLPANRLEIHLRADNRSEE